MSNPSLKKYLPQTLLGRSTLIVLLPVLILQIVTVYVFFDQHWARTVGRLSDAVAGEVAVLADIVEHSNDPEQVLGNVLSYTQTHLGLNVQLKSDAYHLEPGMPRESGMDISILKRPAIGRLNDSLIAQLNRPFIIFPDEDKKLYEILVQLKSGALSVTVPERRLYSSSSYVFLLWMIGISLASTLVSMIFLRNQIRPIRKLAIAAERFGRGQDVDNFKPRGAREVRAAGLAFMDMRDRIKRQVEQRTVMLAGVSHDMRTPLTRIKLALSLLPDSDDVRALTSDVSTMEKMLNAYLDFVKGEGTERSETVDLTRLMDDVVAPFRTHTPGITVRAKGPIYLSVRPVALSRALANVISNACRYGSSVRVTVQAEGPQVAVDVEDNGPGISPDKYDDAFRPFVRLDASRHVDAGEKGSGSGVGLGLAIARDLVHAHGGDILLGRSEDLGGLKVRLRLPK